MSELEHYDQELGEIDRQIVRLGMLCGIDATQPATIEAILSGSLLPAGCSADQRKTFVLLKGLLALRYHVEKHCLDEIGPQACQQVLDGTPLK